MKKLLCFSLIMLAMVSCNQEKPEDKMKALMAAHRSDVDLSPGNTPKEFSAKMIDGKTFNSKDYKGKYWVLFAYYQNYLKKEHDYDMVKELNEIHKRFGAQIPMIGMTIGTSMEKIDVIKAIQEAKFDFPQIDNTENIDKQSQVKENIYCGPAKILFDPQGKIIHMTCGGGIESLDYKIDSLIRAKKL